MEEARQHPALMLRRAAFLLLAASLPVLAAPELPSGLAVSPHDVLVEKQPGGENWIVLRYLAPEIADGAIGYDAVVPDLDVLCATDGLAAADTAEEEIAQIVVILMDRPVPRGVADPEATQYIGAYLPIDGSCEWE